jgi:hypothetical protein
METLVDAQWLNHGALRPARVLDGRYVAVQTLVAATEPSFVEVVSIPRRSRAARVNLPPGVDVGLMAWARDYLLWTPGNGSTGVYSSQRPRTEIPGSSGFHLTGGFGAWAVSDQSSTIRWWNLITGERYEAPAGPRPLPCSGTFCVTTAGWTPSSEAILRVVGITGSGGTAVAQSADAIPMVMACGDYFAVVQYGMGERNAVLLLWNLRSNRYARIPGDTAAGAAGADVNVLNLPSDGPVKRIVNLAAIV